MINKENKMAAVLKFIWWIFVQVLIKLVLTICTKEMIGKLMFSCLHKLVSLTSTEKDDEFIDKVEKLYWSISESTDTESQKLIVKIQESKNKDNNNDNSGTN